MSEKYKEVEEIYWEYRKKWDGGDNSALQELIDSLCKYHPCPQHLFQRTTLWPQEAALMFYNIDPEAIGFTQEGLCPGPFLPNMIEEIMMAVDVRVRLFSNLVDWMGVCSPGRKTILKKAFIKFLAENGYPIPAHFPENLRHKNLSEINELESKHDEKNNGDQTSVQTENVQEQDADKRLRRKLRADEKRKILFQRIAETLNELEPNEMGGNPSAIAKRLKSFMKPISNLFNISLSKDELTRPGGINPTWFKHLCSKENSGY